MNIYKKNPPNWSYDSIRTELLYFEKIYSERPIKDNQGGMKYPHMFAFYFILKNINPEFVVESGIWKGQSTWLIEKTLPNANILSLDINLKKREYISSSKRVTYSNKDFINHDFSKIPINSLVFFDDHQNSYERLMQSYFFGFKNVIIDDNYPILHGDTYSLKKIFHRSGLNDERTGFKNLIKALIMILNHYLKKKIDKSYKNEIFKYNLSVQDILPNENHFKNIDKIIETYYEFPPIFKTIETRWGDNWTEEFYPTEKPILDNSYKDKYKKAFEEAKDYNWLCYVKLK
ncbi:MAG: hypothetical protein CMQ73_04065 [Gammaproteobacteria bacterium]|nr:hypothetical protein [Gammaproteobacteria bacterium]|tara:strand:+ start:306 stop:1172 length:867 start_codon:yes stop_codon:yes gene_type:complete